MKIIYYEGLMGIFGNWLTRGHIRKLKKLGYDCERRSWLSKKEIHDPTVIVISHSFGADAAFRNTKKCRLLITLDYRRVLLKQNATHLGHENHLNMYQTKGMRGYVIEGAKNIAMNKISHLRMASSPYIYQLILMQIRRRS